MAHTTQARELIDIQHRMDTIPALECAGIAQLVERNLAKVEVGSSRLLSRSRIAGEAKCKTSFPFLVYYAHEKRTSSFGLAKAGWQSGHAAACKAVYAGSIPTPASISFVSSARVVK